MNKRRLGRGLDSLLGRDEGGSEPTSLETSSESTHVAVDLIDPNPFQPRRTFNQAEIATLADSIRQHGMLQPVLVRAVGSRYQLIAGERRLRASIEAHLHEIPVRVMEMDDQRVHELAMVENLQREDLNPIDKAVAFRDYLGRYGGTQEELAGRLGLDRSTISNLIRLLELPHDVQQAVLNKQITQGHARALLGLADQDSQSAALALVISEGLNVRQTEALVSSGDPNLVKPKVRKDPAHVIAKERAPHIVETEERLRNWLGGLQVMIREKPKERGQIVIDYNSKDEFERILGLIEA